MRLFFVLLGGMVFGFGLAISGMTKPEVVLSFLQLTDLGLLLVMGSGVLVAMLAFKIGPKLFKKSLTGDPFPAKKSTLSKNTIAGAVIFGVGWGISGLCPGSAIASVGIGNYPVLIGLAGMFCGAYIHGRVMHDSKNS